MITYMNIHEIQIWDRSQLDPLKYLYFCLVDSIKVVSLQKQQLYTENFRKWFKKKKKDCQVTRITEHTFVQVRF